MAVIVGKIGPFDETAEKFSDYANRFVSRVAQVFLAWFSVLVMSALWAGAPKTSGAECDFFDSAEPITSQLKSV